MISPHTPPGTKVAIFEELDPKTVHVRPGVQLPGVGEPLTIASIVPCTFSDGDFAALTDEYPLLLLAIGALKKLDLPECLTSLLNTAPKDTDHDVHEPA